MVNVERSDEQARLAALHAFEILDTVPEEAFDRIARLAKTVLQVPIVLISLIDRDRQWFKSRQGMAEAETPRDVSFCSRAIEQSEPLIVPDAQLDPRFVNNPLVTGAPHIRFYIGVQLTNRDGFKLGTLCCIDTKPREVTSDQIAILQDLARLVVDELELRLLATTDSLTGAMTRRAFLSALKRDVALARRHERGLTCVMVDADHFKSVNDSYGHATGDTVLRKLVSICTQELRNSDYIGRLGGEEFAIVLRESDAAAGVDVADRLRSLIAREKFIALKGPFSVTASLGVAALDSAIVDSAELLALADAALYEAKTTGRNRVVLHDRASRRLSLAS
jgi:diguanylate cyclase (GGDEF)-like protein